MNSKKTYKLLTAHQFQRFTHLLAFYCLLLIGPNSWSQSFSKIYPAFTEGWTVKQTQDEGFIITGRSGDWVNIMDNDIFLLKTDADGDEIWSKKYGQHDLEQAFELIETQDGGYVLAGLSSSFSGGPTDIFFLKTDPFGNELWQKKYGGPSPDQANAVLEAADGNSLYLAGCYDCPRPPYEAGRHDLSLIKTDAYGNLKWSKVFGDANRKEEAFDMVELPDQTLLVVATVIEENGNEDILLYKIDPDGNLLSQKTYGGPSRDVANKIISSNDGHFLIGGLSFAVDPQGIQADALILKIDAEGSLLWTKYYGGPGSDLIDDMLITQDGGIAFSGVTWSFGFEDGDFYLVKLNAEGNELWTSTTGGPGEQGAKGFTQTKDGGFAMVGITQLGHDLQLIRTNGQGQLLNNNIRGNVFHDRDQDCQLDPGERNLSGWMVEAKGEKNYYATTDALGNFSIQLTKGNYLLRVQPPNDYLVACQTVYTADLTQDYDSLELDFPMQSIWNCPYLEIDVSTPVLSPCNTTVYEIRYSNTGTAAADRAFAEIELDPHLEFLGSNALNEINQNGQKLHIDLATIPAGESGSISLQTRLSCTAIPGKTHGVTANIFPKEFCNPPHPDWDGSSIVLSGACEGDSVKFEIQNTGEPTTDPVQFIVVEDDIVVYIDSRDLELEPNPKYLHYTTGKTYRMMARQSARHPGKSMPSVALEGCPDNNTGNISLGYVTQFPDDDADDFVSVDNQENVLLINAQQIRGFPKGRKAEHFIKANTDIEYHIRFQNTSLYNVSRVVIRDSLSPIMDAATVQLGASSHPLFYEVYNDGIVKFIFDDINLPSKYEDEAGSFGFVKFRVSQDLNNPPGSIIDNTAAIYYDQDAPVRIDPIFHTIEKEKLYAREDLGICENQPHGGSILTDGDILYDTLSFSQHDEITLSFVSILENAYTQIDTILAYGGLYNGIAYYKDTIIEFTIPASNKCDSTINVNISVNTTPTKDIPELNTLETFPNPFSEQLNLVIELDEATEISLHLYNLLGQKFQTIIDNAFLQQGLHNISIPVEGLSPGNYQLLLKTEKGRTIKKIIKLE